MKQRPELLNARQPADGPAGIEIRVEITQPFSLEHSAECGQAFRWNRIDDYYYCVIDGMVLKIRQEGHAVYASLFPGADAAATTRMLSNVFRFDDDMDRILAEISSDAHIREAAGRHGGLRLLRQDPWECLISYLCSINSNIPRIKGDVERICANYGSRVVFDGKIFHTFPDVDTLAETGESELRKLKLGFRAEYIAAAARKVRDEKIDLLSLRHASYEEALEVLLSFHGVGPKVADCVLLFSMDKLEAFPVDRWVKRGVEMLYFGGQRVPERRVREWARNRFGKYAGYAQEYLFYGSRLRELYAAH
ncbi:MAG: DNA glycosylase [Methanomassiliicoccales archaeon]|nr:DNA glycosylase [Methanomassiliicoccales archaeon]